MLTTKKVIDTIRTARKRKGMRQAEMADLLHMNLVAYKRLEQMQTKLDVVRLIDIVRVLKIKIEIK